MTSFIAHPSQISALIVTVSILFSANHAEADLKLLYPSWFENPTFSIENNYSASSCIPVRNNDLQAAKEAALNATREEIASYLNGIPTDIDGSSSNAAKGVYLSASERVFDQDLVIELFCVLGSLPYSRIEDEMNTGMTASQLHQALKDLAPAIDQAARGIVNSPSTPADFYQNATAFAEMKDTTAALAAYQSLLSIAADFWDAHESFIEFSDDVDMRQEAIETYAQLKLEHPENSVVLLANAALSSLGTDDFTKTTDAIIETYPDCLLCYGMSVAQYTYQYTDQLLLTKTQEGRQMAAFEEIDRLGGIRALRVHFMLRDNFDRFQKTLEVTRSNLELRASMAAAQGQGANSLSLAISDGYPDQKAYFDKQLSKVTADANELLRKIAIEAPEDLAGATELYQEQLRQWAIPKRPKKPDYIRATILGLGEQALQIKWRIRDQFEYRIVASAGEYTRKIDYGSMPWLAEMMAKQADQMDRGYNMITKEHYIRPGSEIEIPGHLPPGEYVVDIIYTDLRGEEVGPLSIKYSKEW